MKKMVASLYGSVRKRTQCAAGMSKLSGRRAGAKNMYDIE